MFIQDYPKNNFNIKIIRRKEFVEKFVQDYWRRFRKKKNKKTKMGEQITVVREKRNVVLRSLENAENETN